MFGAVTQVDVGLPLLQVEGAGRPAVMLELLTNPSLGPPTPKNIRSVVPLENSVSGEHSSPLELFTTHVFWVVEVIKWLLSKLNMYIFGFEGTSCALVVPETNPQAIK